MLRLFVEHTIRHLGGNAKKLCHVVDRHKGRAGTKKSPPVCEREAWGCGSGERHAVLEFAGPAIGGDEPLSGFLEDALATVAEELEQGIEAALGGGGLPATVKQSDEVFADLCNLVAMEADDGDALVAVNRGVSRGPIAGGVGGLAHCGFDLAHDALERFGGGGWFPSPR